MAGIVCAIRGGSASQPTIAHAIDLAKETALPLHFLYVVNLDFLARTSISRVHVVAQEMEQMGNFILLTAQTNAEMHGVAAQRIVRHGDVTEEIIKLCHELGADYVVLGHPQVRHTESVFTHDRLAEFVEKIEQLTGAKVVMAQVGEK
jgi:nucleotide-binding universal stress UspA family protein